MAEKNETDVAKVEAEAHDLVKTETEKSNTENTEQQQTRRLTERRRARRTTRHLYADDSVPRVLYERRYGSTSRSRAYLIKALTLYSDQAQIFFENNYETVNTCLIVSTLVVEAVGGLSVALHVGETLEKKFSDMETEMVQAVEGLEKVANEKGIAPQDQVPAYDHARQYEPPLHTPQSAQFMTLVSLYDRIVARADGAWINKIISSQTRKTLIQAWRKQLVNFVRQLQQLRRDALQEAHKAGFGARADAIDTQARNETKAPIISEKDPDDASQSHEAT